MIFDKNRIIKLYLDGYKASDIAFILNEKSRTVQRIIREYKKKLKSIELDRIERIHYNNKKIRQEENKENKKYMQDATVASKNPSAYKVNKNGDWILDKSKQNYTCDMPLIVKNNGIREYAKTFKNKKIKKWYN